MSATALSASLSVSPALAQTAEAELSKDVIIVTAQRREEAFEDVPMTVNLLDAETLANAGVTNMDGLANVTSGFQLGRGGAIPQPAVRGVTTIIGGAYENNVAVYIDGLYQPSPHAISIDLPNIDSVQILKGPQGTLYGRNATGGAILLDTKGPTEVWEGKLEGTYGKYDDRRIGGYVSGPLANGIGVSVAGYTRRRNGYVKEVSRTVVGETVGRVFPMAQDSLRAKLKFELSPSFDATLGYAYTHTADFGNSIFFGSIENLLPSYAAFPGGQFRPYKIGEAASHLPTGVEVKEHDFFLKLNLDLGMANVRSTTGYIKMRQDSAYDFDGSYAENSYSATGYVDKTFQQLIDVNLDLGEHLELMVGAQYFNIKTDTDRDGGVNYSYQGPRTYDPAMALPLSAYQISSDTSYQRTKEAWAVFADATIHATDRLSVIVGGRYSEETQDNTGRRWSGGNRETGSRSFEATKGSKYTKFTPRASIRYEITPRTSIYASYQKGFKSGEWTYTLAPTPDAWEDVNQESVDGFEVGLKHASRGLRYDLSAFYMDYTNLQISYTNFIGTRPVTVLQNAPSAEIYGVEGNFDIELFENFSLRGGATWLHARYGDGFLFDGLSVNPAVLSASTNENPLKTFVNINARQDLSGKQMSRAPNFAAYIGFDYLVPMGDGGISFSANAKYTDDYVVSNPSVWGGWIVDPLNPDAVPGNETLFEGSGYEQFASKQRFVQKGYALLNASVTYTDPSDTYYVRLWGNNLSDKHYRQHYNGTSVGTYSPLAEPRTYGVTVGIKFSERNDVTPPSAPPPPAAPPPPPAAPETMTCPDGTVVGVGNVCPMPPPPPPPTPERG